MPIHNDRDSNVINHHRMKRSCGLGRVVQLTAPVGSLTNVYYTSFRRAIPLHIVHVVPLTTSTDDVVCSQMKSSERKTMHYLILSSLIKLSGSSGWNSQLFLTPTVRSRLLMDWLFKTISLSRWNWRKHKLDEDSKTHSLYCCSSIRCTNLTNEIKRNNYRKHIYISFL